MTVDPIKRGIYGEALVAEGLPGERIDIGALMREQEKGSRVFDVLVRWLPDATTYTWTCREIGQSKIVKDHEGVERFIVSHFVADKEVVQIANLVHHAFHEGKRLGRAELQAEARKLFGAVTWQETQPTRFRG